MSFIFRKKGATVETELEKALDTLYTKTVPAGVRDFIDMRSGTAPTPTAPKPRKPKALLSSAVVGENSGDKSIS